MDWVEVGYSCKELDYFRIVTNIWWQALFARLGVDNTDGRLSGQEHRGPFPHTLFLQPQSSVIERVSNILNLVLC